MNYLDLLYQRPGAFEHAKPIRRWRPHWPPVYEHYLTQLRLRLEEPEAMRWFVQVLQLHTDFAAEEIEAALLRALESDCFHPDGVHHLLLVQRDPPPVVACLNLDPGTAWPLLQVNPPDLGQYNRLLMQEG